MSGENSGIQLIEVRVRNFRSLHKVDVYLDELTLFVGENNAGKTSLLEAMYAAVGAGRKTLSPDDIFLNKGESKPPKERSVYIDLLFRPVDEDGIVESFPEGSPWTAWWGKSVGQDDDDNDFVALRTRLQWNAGKGEYTTERRFLTEWVDSDALETAKVNEQAGNLSSTKLGPVALYFMDAKRDIQDELQNRSSFWHKLIADPGLSDQQIKTLEETLSQLNEQIIADSEVLSHVQRHLNDLYQTIAAERGKVNIQPLARHLRDLSRGMDVHFSTPGAEAFSLSRHGMGTRSLAAVLTFRAYSEWRQKSAKGDAIHPMLALEEPEAHLHPQAQRALFQQIDSIPGQRLISTHSPYIASQVEVKRFRHFRKVGSKTVVTQMDIDGLDQEDLRKIDRMVPNTRGELLFARALVFCEGETEEQALPIYAKAYWGEHINTLGISMLQVGGGGYLPFARLAESFSIPWYLFSDGEQDTIGKLKAFLRQLGKPEEPDKNDNVFIIPNNKNYEEYLIGSGYPKELVEAIIKTDSYNDQHAAALHKDWQKDPDTLPQRLDEKLSAHKTKYARPVAEVISALADHTRRFPPLVRQLFHTMSTQIPELHRKEAE